MKTKSELVKQAVSELNAANEYQAVSLVKNIINQIAAQQKVIEVAKKAIIQLKENLKEVSYTEVDEASLQ